MDRPENGWYWITPAWAAAALERDRRKRPIGAQRVARIAAAIVAKAWVPNGESMVLAPNGEILDGNHRADACVKSGKPILLYIVWLPIQTSLTAAFDSMDQCKPRGISDRLATDGIPYYGEASGLARMIWMWENGYRSMEPARATSAPTPKDIRLIYDRNADAIQSVIGEVSPLKREIRGWLGAVLLSFVYYKARETDEEKARAWLTHVATGANIAPSNPTMLLRKRLMDASLTKATLRNREVLALLIKSWCLYRDKRVVKQLKWDSRTEFPDFTEPS